MKVEFIRKNRETHRLILVFAGWSTSPGLYAELQVPGWDVAVVHDYSSLLLDLSFLNDYSTIYVFAWSLGVCVAENTLPAKKITAAYAINGTLTPVSDKTGIPTAIYYGTLENLDERNLLKFRKRMAGDSTTFKQHFQLKGDEDIDSLKSQLSLIANVQSQESLPALPWRKAFVGMKDMIFPPQGMLNAWKKVEGVNVVTSDNSHYIPIEDVVASVIPDLSIIKQRFSEAASTYNQHAIAQKGIAEALFEQTLEFINCHGLELPTHPRILEIGAGTGLLTEIYSGQLNPKSITIVDLATTEVDCAKECTIEIINEDAEHWIRNCTEQYDLILSSSTIQWFSNIPEFMAQVKRVLKPSGVVAISTFLPGNLEELDSLRETPLHYLSIAQLAEIAENNFTNYQVSEDEYRLEFASPRDLMLHLKRTGVAGSAPSPGLNPMSIRAIKQITYRPAFLLGTN